MKASVGHWIVKIFFMMSAMNAAVSHSAPKCDSKEVQLSSPFRMGKTNCAPLSLEKSSEPSPQAEKIFNQLVVDLNINSNPLPEVQNLSELFKYGLSGSDEDIKQALFMYVEYARFKSDAEFEEITKLTHELGIRHPIESILRHVDVAEILKHPEQLAENQTLNQLFGVKYALNKFSTQSKVQIEPTDKMNTTATKTNLAATESASQNSSGRSGINSDANTNDPVLKSLKLCQLTEIKRDLSWQISNYLFNDEPSHFQFMRTTSVGCTIYLVSLTNKLASDQSRNVQLSVAGPDQRVFLNLIDSASNLKKNLNVIIQN